MGEKNTERITFSTGGDKRIEGAIKRPTEEIKQKTGKKKVKRSEAIRHALIEYSESKDKEELKP